MTARTKPGNLDEKITAEDYESLLDRYQFSTKQLAPGRIYRGRIIKVTPTFVLLDIGFKTEGIIPADDFADPKKMQELKAGMEIEAMLERNTNKEGYLILSKQQADLLRSLDMLEKAYLHKSHISGTIAEKTKGGFNVDVGIPAFLPDSHLDIKPVKDPDSMIGQSFKFRVVKFDRKNQNVVLSRKLILQDEKEKIEKRIFRNLSKGQKTRGCVRSIADFGAFIDLGGIDGLLHITDMSWGKINHPSEVVSIGQEIEVIVLDLNEKEKKISLGIKQLVPNPWENIDKKFPAGTKVKGKVSSLTDFGAFVELDKGVEGLIHISELSWSRKTVHPKKILAVGQEVEVVILEVNAESKRISLGLKQATPHPIEVFKQKYGLGARLKGKVTKLTDFGAFVEIDKDIEGLVHISDISWEKIKNPAEKLKVGQEIEVMVLNIDVEKQKISLGIKQLEGDIWEDFCQRQKVGDILKVKISRIADFGVFVEIVPGIEGVVFTPELDEKKIDNISESYKAGEEKLAKIIRLNPQAKKVSLSFKQAQLEIQKKEFQKYLDSQDNRVTFGDLFKDQLKRINLPSKKTKKEPANDKS